MASGIYSHRYDEKDLSQKIMKILYLAFVRLPTEKAHGVQIMKTCEALADEGVEVELMVPDRETHITESPFAYYDVRENFLITRLSVPDLVGWGSVGFAFSMLWFSEMAKWKKIFWSADIIYSRDAFILLQYLLLGRKLVYEAHTKPTTISKFVAKQAYKLVVISEGLRDAYVSVGVRSDKIIVAHDAIDPEPFKVKYNQEEERRRLSIPTNRKVALYVGKIDSAKGADTFAEASEHLPDEWLAVLIGPESLLKDNLKKKFPKALFLSETPYRDLPRVLSTADVLVLPNSAKDEDASLYTSPLKAFAYIATGKPIIASDVPSLKEILKEGIFFEPDNPLVITEKIKSTFENKTRNETKVYTWNDRAKTIYLHIFYDYTK